MLLVQIVIIPLQGKPYVGYFRPIIYQSNGNQYNIFNISKLTFVRSQRLISSSAKRKVRSLLASTPLSLAIVLRTLGSATFMTQHQTENQLLKLIEIGKAWTRCNCSTNNNTFTRILEFFKSSSFYSRRFSLHWKFKLRSAGLWHRVVLNVVTRVSEKHTTFIKHEDQKMEVASSSARLYGVMF